MYPNSRGRFIVYEGLDGSGTTTQAALLSEWLQRCGIHNFRTHEPTAGAFGAAVRHALEGRTSLDARALALGFAADRMDHLFNEFNGIVPSVEAGMWIVCDRYVLSSLAYQTAQELDISWLLHINSRAITPDLTIFLHTPVDVCVERLSKRSTQRDLFETREQLSTIAEHYADALTVSDATGKLVTVDGSLSPQEVLAATVSHIHPWLGIVPNIPTC